MKSPNRLPRMCDVQASDVQASDIQATGLNGRHSGQCQGTFRPGQQTSSVALISEKATSTWLVCWPSAREQEINAKESQFGVIKTSRVINETFSEVVEYQFSLQYCQTVKNH
ncbi:hypothetical protein DAPPUDRAFT_252896 [Daphnia pulex]|uniref:Uncharacterized protein n=1 Tax=Daphnia pulex TaxID=6669 RepID=E9H3Q7_DAPPU|nr:hypothetical protein DAPPUDRAFT_252896 [Daphnia pulex]|eukprot:EFX73556.1 hypothetical protein DAPPUDRAFT_252896 [Daphnia pulex]